MCSNSGRAPERTEPAHQPDAPEVRAWLAAYGAQFMRQTLDQRAMKTWAEVGMVYAVSLAWLSVALLLATPVAWAASTSPARRAEPAAVFQLVQEREGRRACWGVVIRLNRLAFKPSIKPSQLEIRDDKHDSDLRDAMRREVDRDGKRLTIQWQPGRGDFGTGNGVRVCVDRSAFRNGRQPSNDRECWQIGTDLL